MAFALRLPAPLIRLLEVHRVLLCEHVQRVEVLIVTNGSVRVSDCVSFEEVEHPELRNMVSESLLDRFDPFHVPLVRAIQEELKAVVCILGPVRHSNVIATCVYNRNRGL